jgi:hypothetical protein
MSVSNRALKLVWWLLDVLERVVLWIAEVALVLLCLLLMHFCLGLLLLLPLAPLLGLAPHHFLLLLLPLLLVHHLRQRP